MQFALQYALARSWIDSGVQVAAVIGHSFGELTALCVSGTLSVKDTLKVIAGRARAIEKLWSHDRGRMLAVDSDLETLERQHRKSRRTGKLEKLVEDVIFREPIIVFERATREAPDGPSSKVFDFASHMRDPMYFHHAVQRLVSRYPSSIWIESGSASASTPRTPVDEDIDYLDNVSDSRRDGKHLYTNGIQPTGQFSASSITDTFTETRLLTDQFIKQRNLAGYSNHVQPRLTELVVVYTLDTFEELGCALRPAEAGKSFGRITYLPKHKQVADVLYGLLEKARLIDLGGNTVTGTAVPAPRKSAEELLPELLRNYPEHSYNHKLTSLTGTKLADCLAGKTEAIQLIFGSAEGRELVSGMYGKSPFNVAWIDQLKYFWERLLARVPQYQQEPINILEIGASTGGTTAGLLPFLARSGVPVCYTATDISPSLVSGLRKRFKEYPWIHFEIIDIEKAPPSKHLESQHMVLATNCMHATRSLAITIKNIHRILRPDGFPVMLEMTEAVPWIDSVFGLVDGWWLFNDGRQHALAQSDVWEKTLRANRYGHLDWTDGHLPENSIQRIIIALASSQPLSRVPISPPPPSNRRANLGARQVVIDSLVHKHTQTFRAPSKSTVQLTRNDSYRHVLVTGATGSLGSHLVAHLAAQPDVRKVICLNRISSSDPITRQLQALKFRDLMNDGLFIKT
ncbi:S-adenosyl-L-methionine-dependent methyltransferase [Phaeosphaeriaceae sp. PMI808]|nr:S-adenosyl-L-methionine-dependent methyltransferase [Phaeosphaeriaceae sp. PMI808]